MISGAKHAPQSLSLSMSDSRMEWVWRCEARLGHKEQAEQFYHELSQRGVPVRVGMEASGHARWFERLLNELQFELWIGDAAAVRTKRVRKQKTDRQDAQLLLRLLLEERFPKIWVYLSQWT